MDMQEAEHELSNFGQLPVTLEEQEHVRHPNEFMDTHATGQLVSKAAQVFPPDELPVPPVSLFPVFKGAIVLGLKLVVLFLDPLKQGNY